MVPEGQYKADSWPNNAAQRSCSSTAAGSSAKTSSPVLASYIALSMSDVGRVMVSDRKSMEGWIMLCRVGNGNSM